MKNLLCFNLTHLCLVGGECPPKQSNRGGVVGVCVGLILIYQYYVIIVIFMMRGGSL